MIRNVPKWGEKCRCEIKKSIKYVTQFQQILESSFMILTYLKSLKRWINYNWTLETIICSFATPLKKHDNINGNTGTK